MPDLLFDSNLIISHLIIHPLKKVKAIPLFKHTQEISAYNCSAHLSCKPNQLQSLKFFNNPLPQKKEPALLQL